MHYITEPPYWGDWQDWSQCSKKCGGGISYRRRRCYQSKCPDPYQKKCTGTGYEEKKCNEQCCPGILQIIYCVETDKNIIFNRKTILG